MDNKKTIENSRTKNALLNITWGYIAQVGIFILSFVGRRIFLKFLAAEYLGINGLYSNILTILSLAELGLDSAVIYSLYKPVAEKDVRLISSLMHYFKKIYYALALVIFVLGILLIPFLKYIINSDLPSNDLIFYYILFLLNTVLTYFVAHKVALFSAFQEQRITKIVTLSLSFILQIVYIVVLIVWHNYYAYLMAMVVTTIISNVLLSAVCSKYHADIFENKERVKFEKKEIVKRIYSTFLYKVGAVLINSTDNILISVLVSTVAVGLYSNYYTVINSVQAFIAIVTTSLISGIGNLAVNYGKKRQMELFDTMIFFYHGIAAVGLTGFILLFNDLITVWIGEEYLFSLPVVVVIALNFYLTNAISPIWMFREANGLFDKVKFLLLIRAGINIILSIILGGKFGVFGIFTATAVSLLVTSFWYEPRILYGSIFDVSQIGYWKKQIKYGIATVISFIISYLVTMNWGKSIIMLGIRGGSIVLITGTIFCLVSFKTKESKELLGILNKYKKNNKKGEKQ